MPSNGSFALSPFLQGLTLSGPILDLGCGTGLHARALAAAGQHVVGLDIDVDALDTARSLAQTGETVHWCAGSTLNLPFADATFAGILCLDVLHWSVDAAAFDTAWGEAWRVLRPGGLFCVRLRLQEFAPERGDDWYLTTQTALEYIVARDGGEWIETPARDGESACFLLKKFWKLGKL